MRRVHNSNGVSSIVSTVESKLKDLLSTIQDARVVTNQPGTLSGTEPDELPPIPLVW